MKKLWLACGRLAFWVTWPGLYLYLRWSQRTRVVVIYDQKVLVTKAWLSDGKWSLPGGGLHQGETALAGVSRELQEETGLILKAAVFQSLGSFQFKNHGLVFAYQLFSAQVATLPILNRQRREITELAWLSPGELTAANSAPDVLQALQTWLPSS
jgi:8-oxo-dGTP pyrophosphatase MutT (NUDIX family)